MIDILIGIPLNLPTALSRMVILTTFFQRGNADTQHAHEKMLKITNFQGIANQNHNKLSPHTWQNYLVKKTANNKLLARR